jgi:hypothetical protein
MRTEVGQGVGIAVGAEVDTGGTSFSNDNAAGWARNWFIIAVLFIIFVVISGRGR